MIPSDECEIDTELLFQPEIELCVAHPFIWPRTGVFNKDGSGVKLVAIEQPKANMGQDNSLKVGI